MFASLIPSLLPLVGDVLDRFFPDKEKAEQAKREIESQLTEHLANIDLAQLEVNKAEAASSSLFKGGWRPFVGWTCGIALLYHFLLQPIIVHSFKDSLCSIFTPNFFSDVSITFVSSENNKFLITISPKPNAEINNTLFDILLDPGKLIVLALTFDCLRFKEFNNITRVSLIIVKN